MGMGRKTSSCVVQRQQPRLAGTRTAAAPGLHQPPEHPERAQQIPSLGWVPRGLRALGLRRRRSCRRQRHCGNGTFFGIGCSRRRRLCLWRRRRDNGGKLGDEPLQGGIHGATPLQAAHPQGQWTLMWWRRGLVRVEPGDPVSQLIGHASVMKAAPQQGRPLIPAQPCEAEAALEVPCIHGCAQVDFGAQHQDGDLAQGRVAHQPMQSVLGLSEPAAVCGIGDEEDAINAAP
mmetsp:Transcript_102788/g.329661  ORF Transcript_102788/g.329661 Transcript_102788/m.329661 type:complete len:232 (+) Transcript_102788:289-984(+)